MSFLKQNSVNPSNSKPLRSSITLLKKVQKVEDGHVVNSTEFVEDDFSKSPYSEMTIDDFSIGTLLATGAAPSQTFVASSDVDTVMHSVENLKKSLENHE